MIDISELKHWVDNLPTIMNFDDELYLIKMVMSFDSSLIVQHQRDMTAIIEAIHLSHTDNGYMEANEDDRVLLNKFAVWLKYWADKGIDIPPFIADNFKM